MTELFIKLITAISDQFCLCYTRSLKVAGVDRSSTSEKTIQPGCTIKLAIYQLLFAAASSNLVGKKQFICYFIVSYGRFFVCKTLLNGNKAQCRHNN